MDYFINGIILLCIASLLMHLWTTKTKSGRAFDEKMQADDAKRKEQKRLKKLEKQKQKQKPSPTPITTNDYSDKELLGEHAKDFDADDFDENGNFTFMSESKKWQQEYLGAQYRIGRYNKNYEIKNMYCTVEDLTQNSKGDWVVDVYDFAKDSDKSIKVDKIDELEDKWGVRFSIYEAMVEEFADKLDMEVDAWGLNELADEEEETIPPVKPQKVIREPRKRVPKEEASHSMVYVDSKGDLSERKINLRGIETKNGKVYMNAYCFKRNRLRTFVAKNIMSLHDLTTNQTYATEDDVYNELLNWVSDD